MNIDNVDAFIDEMKARGYRKGHSFHSQFKPEYSLWKSFRKGGDEWEHKGYQICIGIWDNRKFDNDLKVHASFDMKMNHQTPIQVDRLDLGMSDDTMNVEEFERRCEALWDAMLIIMPRTKNTTY